jgi:peptide chain release factor subunit 1
MLISEKKFGFVIIDGTGTLWATLQGSAKEILQEISVMLPKKHGRGGQSAPRFGRIRLEKRLAYLKKIAEMTTKNFINSDNKLIVEGIILGGSANFKSDLEKGEVLDERI